ncbi:MAG: hypothetical protein AAB320_09540 [Elusimicrobiota bacterium]
MGIFKSEKVIVEKGYECPLCPDHRDTEFIQSPILRAPLCEGCDEELFHFSGFDERPDDPLIEKLEKLSGKSWQECKVILLREHIKEWQAVEKKQASDHRDPKLPDITEARQKIRWYSDLLATAETEPRQGPSKGKD